MLCQRASSASEPDCEDVVRRRHEREVGGRDHPVAGIALRIAEGGEGLEMGAPDARFLLEFAGGALVQRLGLLRKPPGSAQDPLNGSPPRG